MCDHDQHYFGAVSVYDRDLRVIRHELRCEGCGIKMSEVGLTPYVPNYQPTDPYTRPAA